MLKTIDSSGQPCALDQAVWTDLCEPTEEEIAEVERHFDIRIPTRANLSEIEASSRLRLDRDRLVMSAPLVTRHGEAEMLTPAGFLLLPGRLVTVRFTEMTAFDHVHEAVENAKGRLEGGAILVQLLEVIVDRSADRLERIAEEMASVSHAIFRDLPADVNERRRLGRETRRLRALMVRVGRASEQMVRVRQTFLAIGRIANFVEDRCEPKIGKPLRERLESVREDIASLDEFENSLTDRVQLLLDAATGFISIDQNEVVKVLTVVSVAGVPPVLVAGIYGMNFHNMPELAWPWGYPLSVVLMVVTTILPIVWFKWRDWL